MRSNLTVLTILTTALLGAQVEAQQNDRLSDYLTIAAASHAAPTRFSSYVGDLDLVSAGLQKSGKGCGHSCSCSACTGPDLFGRMFASAEFMHWYNKGRTLPPLVTTSPTGTLADVAGVLDANMQPVPGQSSIRLGGDEYGGGQQVGGRATLGMWLDEQGERAIGFRGFGTEGRSLLFAATSTNGDPILARPFFNDDPLPLVNGPDALIVGHPTVSQFGSIGIKADHDVYGGQAFVRKILDCGRNYRLDVIGGYRYDNIHDDLAITTFVQTAANTFTYNDLFDVKNEYNAGELGFLGEIYRDCWTFSFLTKVALGNMKQVALINGEHIITGGGATQGAGGLLTQPTNINSNGYERDLLVWAPEANFKLSYAYSDRLSVTVGYSFMYWTRVALAGDQVDFNVNGTQLNGGTPVIGPLTPAFNWRDTDYWVQTIDIGGSINY